MRDISAQMKAAPAVPADERQISVTEAKEALRDGILAMYKKGYTVDKIIEFLKNIETPISIDKKYINSVVKKTSVKAPALERRSATQRGREEIISEK